MNEEKRNNDRNGENNLENEKTTNLQKRIEEKIAEDEQQLAGEQLSGELSRDRTHMSEHRTRMSEHRTGLSEHRTELSEKRTGLSDERTVLSYQRTALSYERTLMSWVRTATSLITFGFTIYKFFEEVQKESPHPRLITPRMVGLLMIAFGFIGLLFAQVQHHMAYKQLRERYPDIQKSLTSVLGALTLAFGLLLFFATLFRQ
jgi:putative membrane protein